MIIVGLGNPGKEYEGTRHNVGYAVVDALVAGLKGLTWNDDDAAIWSQVGQHLIMKPFEFMNVSGASLESILDDQHLHVTAPTDLIIVHDDLDFPLGEIHEQVNRSAGGHQGVQSIISALGTQNFTRLRIGIGNNRDVNVPAEEYVLQKFSTDEQPIINQAVERAVKLLSQKVSA